MIEWTATGDSFTYLNDHLDETGYLVSRGYLSRIADRIEKILPRDGSGGKTRRASSGREAGTQATGRR